MKRLGPPCLQVGETDRQLDNQESFVYSSWARQAFLCWLLSWYEVLIALFECNSAVTEHPSLFISSDETPFHRVHRVRPVNLRSA